MNQERRDDLYWALARAIYLATGVVLLIWFLDTILHALLLITLAIVLALALNPPITWLEHHKIPRIIGTLLVSLIVLGLLGLLAWLVIPNLIEQVVILAADVPRYVYSLAERAQRQLSHYPQVQKMVSSNAQIAQRIIPTLQTILVRVGRYSLSLITLLIIGIILASTIIYFLTNPRPLLKGYLMAFPQNLREPAARAFTRSSQMVMGWVYSNLIVGSVEGIAAVIFLNWMGIPGAFVWGTLTFFSELVPKLGPYLMTIPPVLIALAVDPIKAIWVLIFYVALQEITGDVLAPLVRSSQMEIHPFSLIFGVLAMTTAFGFLGAILSTPVTGFVKIIYDEFYLANKPEDNRIDEQVDRMLSRQLEEKGQ